MYVTQTLQTTDSTQAVQGACFNQLATTLYTPAACQQSRNIRKHTLGCEIPVDINITIYVLSLIHI